MKERGLDLPRSIPKRVALLCLSFSYVLAGANHFLNADFYLAMMPPYLPAHLSLVYLSGVLESLGGVAVVIPKFRSRAGWGLIVLLIVIFPANLHMALNPELFPDFSTTALYLRLPLQIPLVVWAYWATRPDAATSLHSPSD